MDPVIVSYENSWLRRSDVSLLEGPHWLNDQIIGFAFDYFASDCFKTLSQMAAFISPEVTQFIKFCDDMWDLCLFLEPLDLASRQWIFLAVNDNCNQEAGGSHWSLLAFVRASGKFIHYDSFYSRNSAHAKHIAKQLEPFLGMEKKLRFQEKRCPQQCNSYDCGMYVLSIAEILCEKAKGETRSTRLVRRITPAFISQKREEWCKRIQTLVQRAAHLDTLSVAPSPRDLQT
ncbi:sentrin-specific protease 8-like [Synchiropus splendidus]|uniref:sentrin-specific protease 8-like n=1 Tax=Synchiropus splendidus TaxID=270530 RepID=UPI00237D9B9B|nr:sentrin-specific protease 8-like [Synchiropus splendidus]XP_053721344.1 sentrin-specific protease 8-like [Synchiropus splendidus]